MDPKVKYVLVYFFLFVLNCFKVFVYFVLCVFICVYLFSSVIICF